MKKLLFVLLALISTNSYAQKSLEFGVSLGATSYLGDLKPETFRLNQNSFALGLQSKLNLNSLLAARVALNYGTIKGDDALTDRTDLMARNLSFRSRIIEMALIGEFNFLHFSKHPLNKSDRNYYKFSPYLFGGVALFNFNPETKYNGRWYDLQPLGTEGQDVPNSNVESYNLTQISIPIGAGFKYQLDRNIIISYEIGWRKTFTDYLDDVSGNYYDLNEIRKTNGNLAAELAYRGDELPGNNGDARGVRGNPENKDWYIMSNVTFSYKLFRRHGRFTTKY